MTTIYIITKGSYSDYHICAVFDDKEAANRYAKHMVADIEEWELNPNIDKIRTDKFPYLVYIYVDSANISNVEPYPTGWDLREPTLHEYPTGNPKPPFLSMVILAKDKEHAAKIAMEKRTQWLLENDYTINSPPPNL